MPDPTTTTTTTPAVDPDIAAYEATFGTKPPPAAGEPAPPEPEAEAEPGDQEESADETPAQPAGEAEEAGAETRDETPADDGDEPDKKAEEAAPEKPAAPTATVETYRAADRVLAANGMRPDQYDDLPDELRLNAARKVAVKALKFAKWDDDEIKALPIDKLLKKGADLRREQLRVTKLLQAKGGSPQPDTADPNPQPNRAENGTTARPSADRQPAGRTSDIPEDVQEELDGLGADHPLARYIQTQRQQVESVRQETEQARAQIRRNNLELAMAEVADEFPDVVDSPQAVQGALETLQDTNGRPLTLAALRGALDNGGNALAALVRQAAEELGFQPKSRQPEPQSRAGKPTNERQPRVLGSPSRPDGNDKKGTAKLMDIDHASLQAIRQAPNDPVKQAQIVRRLTGAR